MHQGPDGSCQTHPKAASPSPASARPASPPSCSSHRASAQAPEAWHATRDGDRNFNQQTHEGKNPRSSPSPRKPGASPRRRARSQPRPSALGGSPPCRTSGSARRHRALPGTPVKHRAQYDFNSRLVPHLASPFEPQNAKHQRKRSEEFHTQLLAVSPPWTHHRSGLSRPAVPWQPEPKKPPATIHAKSRAEGRSSAGSAPPKGDVGWFLSAF